MVARTVATRADDGFVPQGLGRVTGNRSGGTARMQDPFEARYWLISEPLGMFFFFRVVL